MELMNFANYLDVLDALTNSTEAEEFRFHKRFFNKFIDFANYMGNQNYTAMRIIRDYKRRVDFINQLGRKLGVY